MKIIITEHQLRKLITEDYSPDIDFDRAKQFVSAMKSRGFSELESIALAGNVAQETGGTYNAAIKQNRGGPGRGLFQWEMPDDNQEGKRFEALEAYADYKGTKWSDKNTQYDFIRNELLYNYNEGDFNIKDHLPDYDNGYYTRLYKNNIKPHKDLETLTSKISSIVFGCPSCGEGGSSNITRKDNSIKIKDKISGISDDVEKKDVPKIKPIDNYYKEIPSDRLGNGGSFQPLNTIKQL